MRGESGVVETHVLSSREDSSTDSEEAAIAAEPIQGCSTRPSGRNTPAARGRHRVKETTMTARLYIILELIRLYGLLKYTVPLHYYYYFYFTDIIITIAVVIITIYYYGIVSCSAFRSLELNILYINTIKTS